MTAAINDIQIVKLGTDELPPPALLSLPVAANKILYAGTAVGSDVNGNCVDVGDPTCLFVWGRCERQVNNLATNLPFGAVGSFNVLIRPGVYYYNQDGSITAVNVGQACYFVDNNTVSINSGGVSAVRPFAGIICPPGAGQAGISFQGQGVAVPNIQVPVYLGAPSCVGLTLRYTVLLPLVTIQAQTSGTQFNLGVPMPASARLVATEINVLTPLSGGGATAATMSLQGGVDAAGSILAAQSVFTGASLVTATAGSNPYAARGGQQLKATLTATTGTLAGLTAGSVSVDVFYTIAP